MISVSSSDARSEIGLGFAGMEEEIMEEDNDFDEESTHSYVSCVDPDVALSYIDEKLENVLGHFQKDFEGGVSAENLGAKFGGYGSFLSMYQRSPACSRPKTPPEVQNQVVVPQVSVSGSTSKAPASEVLVKLKNFVKSSSIGTPDSKQRPVSKTSSSSAAAAPSSNHKTLRLRIKVGSSDLSSLKNNSKQGLNMPPSTSSRVNGHSEKVEQGLLYGIHDSPTKILMAMVSFPLRKDQLLSPLSDDLIMLGKKDASVNKSDSKSKHHVLGVSDCKLSTAKPKKENLKERVKYMPSSSRLNGNHIVSNTEKEADNESCDELVSKTLKLPLLSSLSPSYIHPAKEIEKVSDSYVESTLRGKNNGDLDAALIGSKPDLEKAPIIEHVDYSSVDKVSESEARNEEQNYKSKLPKAHKSVKSSSRNSLRGKDAAVNRIDMNVSDKLQEDIGGSEDKGFFGDSGESKEEKQSSLVLKAKKEKLSEVNGLKESFSSVKSDEEACNHLINSSDLNEDKDNSKQNVRWEVNNNNNKHSDEGGIEDLGMEPERELSGTCKKPKTGKSRFSAVDQPESNKIVDVVNKTTTSQASSQKEKDIAKTSSHDDRKRKQKENKESGDYMRVREAAVMVESSGDYMRVREAAVMVESSGEKDRKKKRLKGSSCDRDRGVSLENGRDSASHLPFTASSSRLHKDSGSETIETNVHEAKDSLVESLAPSALGVLDPRELKSGRKSERDEHHDTDSNGGDTLKRCRDGEGYSTIDKPGTRKKAAEVSKGDNLLIKGKATHSWDKERAYGEKCSVERYKPKKSGRYSGDNCTEGESQRKNREEGQARGTAVEVQTIESRSKKRPARKVPMGSDKEGSREYQDPNTKVDINDSHVSAPQKSDRAKTFRGKSNHLEVTAEKPKSKSVGTDQVEVLGHGTEMSNTKKHMLRNDNHDVGSRSNQKHYGSTHKDHVGSNSIKEGAALKHVADRLKNSGSDHDNESIGVYFQAALKFLHGASVLESSSTEHATQKSFAIAKSIDIYDSTAKLCGFCARNYEKNKDMGAAALAYKCMEVAYLRITYSSHVNINRYRNELQASLQVIPTGESPSFVSDGENSNHTLAVEKVALSNSTVKSSPRVTGNHVVSSGNNSSLSQLLAFSQNVSSAMEASKKAQIAFAAAKGGRSSESQYSCDGITSIKKALDFSFQDMDKLLHVVRLAMESINR